MMADAAEASVLTLDVERTGDVAVVKLHGKLKFGVNDVLYSKVSRLIPECKRVVLDLSELTQMDSTGLGTLVRLYVSAKSHGCELQLIHLQAADSGAAGAYEYAVGVLRLSASRASRLSSAASGGVPPPRLICAKYSK